MLVNKTGSEVTEAYKCGSCDSICERPGRTPSGDDYIRVCVECRTVEGSWETVYVDDADNEYPESDVSEKDSFMEKIISNSSELEDGSLGIFKCIDAYCKEHGILDEGIIGEAKQESFKREALAAGIPLSVIEGKTSLRDHFSEEYISQQTNRKE